MRQTLNRYLGRTVAVSTAFVLLALISLIGFIELTKEIQDINVGQYRILQASYYVLLGLPSHAYSLLPIAGLLGSLLGFSLLARHSELTALQASGLSPVQMGFSLTKGLLLPLLLITLIGEWAVPAARQKAAQYKTLLTHQGKALMTNQGAIWIREAQDFLLIKVVVSPTQLHRVSRYEFDAHQKPIRVRFAQRLCYKKQNSSAQGGWMAYAVSSTVLDPLRNQYSVRNRGQTMDENLIPSARRPFAEGLPNDQHIHTTHTAQEHWPLFLTPHTLQMAAIRPDQMSLKQLYDYINYLHFNYLKTHDYILAFWKRVFQPIGFLIMIWLAVPLAHHYTPRQKDNWRPLLSLLAGASYYLAIALLSPILLLWQWPALLSASTPVLLGILLAATLILRSPSRAIAK